MAAYETNADQASGVSLVRAPSPAGLPTAQHRATVQLPSTGRGAHLARHLTVEQLTRWGLPADGEASWSASLVVAELAANAVRHGHLPGRDFQLRLTLTRTSTDDDLLRIEVSDARAEHGPHLDEHPRRRGRVGPRTPHRQRPRHPLGGRHPPARRQDRLLRARRPPPRGLTPRPNRQRPAHTGPYSHPRWAAFRPASKRLAASSRSISAAI
ncbi:ATP-binding protein [Kitasatospora sp. NPDC057223]|uniref:ATP-binding protein n=1 Tax=Kitasatospora sp. NPDC057223 TaxID=3346055 RepID=UPI00363F908F